MKESLSPRELARAVGVSESSVKRWVDAGKIEASKTGGGHRRISVNEAVRYLRSTRSELQDASFLGLDKRVSETFTDPSSQLLNYLKRGDSEQVRALMLSLYLRGWTLGRIFDGPLRYSLEVLRDLGRTQAPGIYFERRAVSIVKEALFYLREFLPATPARPSAVGGAVESKHAELASLAVRLVFEAQRLRATDLGAGVSLETLRLAAEDLNADMVWISLNGTGSPELGARLEALGRQLYRRRRLLILEGRAVDQLELAPQQSLRIQKNLLELEEMILDLG